MVKGLTCFRVDSSAEIREEGSKSPSFLFWLPQLFCFSRIIKGKTLCPPNIAIKMITNKPEVTTMKARKFTIISAILLLLFFLGQFIVAVIEHGWPTKPLYYISSVIEIGLGFLTYRFLELKVTKRLVTILILVFMLLCIGIPVVFYNLNVEFLKPMGGAQLWYLLTILVFWLYIVIKKTRSGMELTGAEKRMESLNKVIAFILLVMIILWFLPKF